MTSSHVLLAVLLGGYSTIAVLSARAVLRKRHGRRRKHAARGSRQPSGAEEALVAPRRSVSGRMRLDDVKEGTQDATGDGTLSGAREHE